MAESSVRKLFGLLFAKCAGLVDSLWLMWVLCIVCLMVLLVVTLLFCVVWFRFRLMRRYLAYRPDEVSRVYKLLSATSEGWSGRGPAHLLFESAAEIGFSWCSQVFGLGSAWLACA